MLKTILLFSILFSCLTQQAQDFSYTRYDIKEGLAGSSVFCAAQDKEGFMWFGTESGLSRFDGVHFKNFTTEDGLPDNEIIGLFCDSKGRTWLIPFRKSICYYYNGKLHTQQNDPLLSKLQLTDNIFFIVEDKSGNLAFAEKSRIHLLRDTSISTITVTSKFTISAMGNDSSGMIQVFKSPDLFHIIDEKLVLSNHKKNFYDIGEVALGKTFFVGQKTNVPRSSTHFSKINLTFFRSDVGGFFNSTPGHINFSILSDSLFADNTNNGAIIYNCNNTAYREHHLSGKSVSSVFLDNEKNLWFCTQREGIYKLNSPFVSGHRFMDINNKQLSVHSLCWHKKNLWVGTEDSYVFTFNPVSGTAVIPPKTNATLGGTSNVTKVLLETKTKDLLIGRQKLIQALSGLTKEQTGSLKDLTLAYGNNVLISTSFGVWMMDVNTFKSTDTVWIGRATTAHYRDSLFYIGTLEGLYIVTKQKEKYFAGNDDPLLKSRIAAIRETPDGTLWIATYDRGIIVYKNKKIIANISKEEGLSSNICRSLFLFKNNLWVGTDNGLNKIVISDTNYAITKYTVADGLLSNFINAVCVDDSLVYVGTPEGVSYFDDKKISQEAPCILRITDVSVSGSSVLPILPFALERRNNNIRFEYAGISYRSGGEILYRYKLSGLDTGWHITKENFLSYPTLLPGDYVMELQAVNKFGTNSEIIRLPFSIKKFWWEEIWIQIFGIILLVCIAILVVNRRIRQVRLREREKNLLREKITLQEQMALKAQMNPHFIFNSLNSIQHYVVDKDIVGANKYIAGFSKLIRLTLDNSSKAEISIEEEIKYLSQYLEMEKMRMGNKFNYSIHVSEEIFNSGQTISPMLLQPFIENSIRHGIRYRNDSNGHIKIEVIQSEKGLKFTIEDNGVGRFISGTFKSKSPIEYQSKGILLTQQRIELMNRNRKEKIEMVLTDMECDGAVTGTRVIIIYPNTNKKPHD